VAQIKSQDLPFLGVTYVLFKAARAKS